MITPASRVRLASKARLRTDRVRGGTLLLYPESGMALSETAARTLACCDGRRVAAMVDALANEYDGDRAEIEADVVEFLQMLADRCLLDILQ